MKTEMRREAASIRGEKGARVLGQINQKSELRRLVERREALRLKLKDHFCVPVSQRNYKEFELIVDELDELRRRIRDLREN